MSDDPKTSDWKGVAQAAAIVVAALTGAGGVATYASDLPQKVETLQEILATTSRAVEKLEEKDSEKEQRVRELELKHIRDEAVRAVIRSLCVDGTLSTEDARCARAEP